MQALEAIATLKALFHVENVAHQFVISFARGHSQLRRRFLDRTERFHHQNGMMRNDCATTFIHDRRMRDAFGITHVHDVPDDIVRIFLERIICRAIEIAA